jgi:hypothetical protein
LNNEMVGKEETKSEEFSALHEIAVTPLEPGFKEIPEPSNWGSSYGIDEAVAIAVVPERALIFWELAGMIAAGRAENTEFRLIRLRLSGEIPQREQSWPVAAVGRFQDSGVSQGEQYLYVLACVAAGEEIPLMVTNTIRQPVRHHPHDISMPSSIDLSKASIERALKRGSKR